MTESSEIVFPKMSTAKGAYGRPDFDTVVDLIRENLMRSSGVKSKEARKTARQKARDFLNGVIDKQELERYVGQFLTD